MNQPIERTAVITYLIKDHSVLLLHTQYPDKLIWNGVSGFVDPGETSEAAAVREIKEEIGVTVQTTDLIKTKELTLGATPFTVFTTTKWQGEPTPQEESFKGLDWFPLNDLPYSEMHEGNRDWILSALDTAKPGVDARIPNAYQSLWTPFEYDGVLYHLTTKENLASIMKDGYLEPRDPYPRPWGGMTAVYLACPTDPLYEETLPHVLAHVKKKHKHVLRLHIKTGNTLYKSLDPERTFQALSLDPIPVSEIIKTEQV